MKQRIFSYIFLSYFLAVLGSGIVAWYTFSTCKNVLEKLKQHDSTAILPVVEESAPIPVSDVDFSLVHELSIFNKCIEEHGNDKFDCTAQVPPRAVGPEESPFDKSDNAYMDSNILIVLIEKLLIVGLAMQLFLTIYTLFLEKYAKFDKYVFHLSDWAINTSPILGVLANLVSFSLLISHEEDIMSVFKGYFYQAVITTLIGGIFYIINLALKAVIHPRIEQVVSL